MKRVFVIDDDQGHEELLRLLRENGYRVAPGGEEDGILLVRSDAPTGPPSGATGRVTPEAGRQPDADGNGPIAGQSGRIGETMRPLLDSPTAMLVSRADDGTVLDGNTPFVRLSGYDRDEMVGRNVLSFFFFLDPGLWTAAFRRVEGETEIRDLETRIFRKDGQVAFVRVSLRREEIDGTPCHVMTVTEHSGAAVGGDTAPESPLAEDLDFDREEVGRLIDFRALQDLMNSFYRITRIGIGINDVNGNVQVATGWQEVCTRFHRINPETSRNCLESDILLSRKLGQGEAIYKCKNGMWDLATPLVIGGRRIANIFLGQFFFEGEVPDYAFYRKQAETYGFDAEEYLAALDRVPRWSRELVHDVMEFYRKLAVMISRLSIGNIRLSQALEEQKRISGELGRAKLVVENSPVVLFRWRAGEGWPVELVSDNVARFGYAREELLSGAVPFSELVHPDDLGRVAAEVGEYTAAGIDSFQQEYRIVTRDGQVRWIDDRTLVERDAAGRVTHYQGTLMDISERKRAEERTQGALAEKIVLLNEVHHRVKNNLQIISSLLDLQSDSIPDERSRGYFRESQDRVRSMALVHERIYRSTDFSSIDFGEYIRDLAHCLFDSYAVGAGRVSLRVSGGEVTLGINEAIPCGLIVNELVSNALKHAFPAHGSGGITIHLSRENDRISLMVADTGAGLPAGLDFRNTHSLGLQLVNMLVRQLRGRIDLDGGAGGTTVSITFPAGARVGLQGGGEGNSG